MDPKKTHSLAPRIDRVLEACLYVDDLIAAERFYRDVLGLEVFSPANGRDAFFRCGEGMLLLFDPTQTRRGGAGVPLHGADGPGHVAFAVSRDELQHWRLRLAAFQVEIEQEMAWPNGGCSLYFRDPAGNSVELATPSLWALPELQAAHRD